MEWGREGVRILVDIVYTEHVCSFLFSLPLPLPPIPLPLPLIPLPLSLFLSPFLSLSISPSLSLSLSLSPSVLLQAIMLPKLTATLYPSLVFGTEFFLRFNLDISCSSLPHSHWKSNAQQMADIWNTSGHLLVRAGDLPSPQLYGLLCSCV